MKLIPFYHARIVFNCQIYKAVISTNSLNNMSLHTSLIPPTHKITEDHKEHTELSKMLIVNMHTCTKVVVKSLSVIIIYIKKEIKEIMEVCYCTVTACIGTCTHAWHLACMPALFVHMSDGVCVLECMLMLHVHACMHACSLHLIL